MVLLEQSEKSSKKRKVLEHLLFELKSGAVVVEGKHDVSTLEKFGITSFTYDLVYKGAELGSRDVYIMTDTDRRGEEKKERISDILSERGYTVDYTTGKRLLNMLNVACVEELYIPLTKALENGDKNGKNILRHSKVHG